MTELPVLIGGHSFGGRMASHLLAERLLGVCAAVYCSFPLHPAGKPDTRRAAHLPDVPVPQLFLSGNRDKLAEPALLEATLQPLVGAALHWLDGADHGFATRRKDRPGRTESVYEEAAATLRQFLQQIP